MKKRVFVLLILILTGVVVLSISLGSVNIPFKEILNTLINSSESGDNSLIITNIRIPRVLGAVVGGGALALSGLLLQIYFDNPIVEPYILGVSSGSMLFMALTVLGSTSLGLSRLSAGGMFVGSLVGAGLVTAILMILSIRLKSKTTLLIVGMMAGYLFYGMTSILMAFSSLEAIGAFSLGSLGSFGAITWPKLKIMTVVTIISSVGAYFLSGTFNALILGEDYGKSVGVNIKTVRLLILLISSSLTAVVTSFAGPVSFVGLSGPHIVRRIFKTVDSKVLIPGSVLVGAIITSLCDLISRTIASPIEIPIGAITGFIGVPIVISFILRTDYQNY